MFFLAPRKDNPVKVPQGTVMSETFSSSTHDMVTIGSLSYAADKTMVIRVSFPLNSPPKNVINFNSVFYKMTKKMCDKLHTGSGSEHAKTRKQKGLRSFSPVALDAGEFLEDLSKCALYM